ncbi:VOC family protein [Maritimibacter dapengensis]|uniref:VOC family protein n=1 Tax=Maritimibacter dapengensis TaxID=2836868 RepID=A0ABS6T5R3_9RHOB|nr:VOC family protein [Maritimibacter dapengensis]MBV7380602.1 VOC family protein [Maritimibacter dapengensis]
MSDCLFPDLKWHHVGYSVNDIEAAITFYGEVFGMEVEDRKYIEPIDTHLVFLRRDNFRFEFFQKAGSEPVPDHRKAPNTDLAEQGTKHPCFSVSDAQAALDALHARSDCVVIGIVRKPGDPMVFENDPTLGPNDPRPRAAAFFFRDPNDIIVEIVTAGNFPD